MFTRRGGESVKGGFYWRGTTWRLEVVGGDRGVLPGTEEDLYVRVPLLVMIPMALFISVAFVVFLPLIGFFVLAEGLLAHGRTAWREMRAGGVDPESSATE